MTTPAPEMPDWTLMVWMLDAYAEKCTGQQRRDEAIEQAAALRSWLAAQPLAPEGGDKDGGGDAPTIDDIVALSKVGPIPSPVYEKMAKAAGLATPPAPAREAVAWQFKDRHGDWHTCMNDKHAENTRDCGQYEMRPLYATPAAGAVVVDEKLVDAALEAYKAGDPWADIPTFCGMRAALTAAIGGAG